MGDHHFVAAHIEGGHVFADPGADEHGRVGGAQAAQIVGEQVVGQLALRQRQAEAHDRLEVAEATDDEVAVRRLGAGHVRRPLGRVAVAEIHGDGAGVAAGLHVQAEVAHHEHAFHRHAESLGRQADAVGGRLGSHGVVACDDDVEVGGADVREALQAPLHRGAPVAGEDAQRQAQLPQPLNDRFGALVGFRAGGAVELEPLQRRLRPLTLCALRQPGDELEKVRVRRAAQGLPDGLEVDGARPRERAVEVKENGLRAERRHAHRSRVIWLHARVLLAAWTSLRGA